MENEPYLLTELEDLSTIFAPLKTTSRIRYTSFNVSNNFLIFGATSGGLYVFRREPCCFLQLLPNKEGAVTQVSISPDEKMIAFATVKGTICILEKTSLGAKHLITALEHQNNQVTSLQWNDGSNELFIGDNIGKVSILTISSFLTTGMFQTPSFVLMQLDSKIVQMDFSSNMLLVSTLTKTYICDTKKEIFRQIGHKPRDGEYGACMFNSQSNQDVILNSGKLVAEKTTALANQLNLSHLKLFCARPGSRIWEVSIDGTVISTHHFKEALAIPPKKIYFLNSLSSHDCDINDLLKNGSCTDSSQINSNYSEQSFNFQKLYVVMSKFFFTFKSDGIYFLDLQRAAVVLWNNEITNIVDVKLVNDVIYVWSGFGKMFALNLIPLEKFIIRLYFQKKYLQLVKLCLEFETILLSEVNNFNKLYILQDLDEKLKTYKNSTEILDKLKPFINICKENALKRKNDQKLKSGMYLVNNNEQILIDLKRMANQKLLRSNCLNMKGRSHSVSPERFQNGHLKHQSSSSSLPDLMKESTAEESYESEILVNGKNDSVIKDSICNNVANTEEILKICENIRKSEEISNVLIFRLFDNILDLERTNNLEQVQCLSFKSFLDENDIDLISKLFHDSLKSKSIFEWLSKLSGEWLTNALKNCPIILTKNYLVQFLELDIKLSRVLKIFSNILNEKDIVELIRDTNIDCYYYCLLEILNNFQEKSSLTSLSDSTLQASNNIPTPKILNYVYFLLTSGQIEQCSKFSETINLNEMVYLMLKFEDESIKTGKSSELVELKSHTMFLSYLDKTNDVKKLIDTCSILTENYIVHCLKDINSAASYIRESSCECWFPCPGLQSSIKMFPEIGYALVDKTWPNCSAKCFEICARIPYLWKYLIYIRRKEPLDLVLPLILQSGEVQEIENRSQDINALVMEMCMKLLIDLKKGKCLNCGSAIKLEGRTVTWAEFGMICIKLLGAKETLELYTKFAEDIKVTDLDQTFFQGVIFAAIMEKQGEGLRRSAIDLLTGKGACESNRIPPFSDNKKGEILGETSKSPDLEISKTSSHHWGIKVNFKENCLICSLPLNTKVLTSEAGLIAFKCSHAFHSACLPKVDIKCPLCEK